jgi:hypothetical protein
VEEEYSYVHSEAISDEPNCHRRKLAGSLDSVMCPLLGVPQQPSR